MPLRSLFIEQYIAQLLEDKGYENGKISPRFHGSLLECPALSLEFLLPFLTAKGIGSLANNPNIPWQYFESRVSELSPVAWENLAKNPGIPSEFFIRNASPIHLEQICRILEPEEMSDGFLEFSKNEPRNADEIIKREWRKPSHSLEDCRKKLKELKYFNGPPEIKIAYQKGIANNPNLTVEFVNEFHGSMFFDYVLIYNRHLPWSFFVENFDEITPVIAALKPQISWEYLLQHEELLSEKRAILSPTFVLSLETLATNRTMTDAFAEKYFDFFVSKGLLWEIGLIPTLTQEFFIRHLDAFTKDINGKEGLCKNPSLPLSFYLDHPEIQDLGGILGNSFTKQFEIENA